MWTLFKFNNFDFSLREWERERARETCAWSRRRGWKIKLVVTKIIFVLAGFTGWCRHPSEWIRGQSNNNKTVHENIVGIVGRGEIGEGENEDKVLLPIQSDIEWVEIQLHSISTNNKKKNNHSEKKQQRVKMHRKYRRPSSLFAVLMVQLLEDQTKNV